jgi:hypothetical protein
MTSLSEVTVQEFQAALTPEAVRMFQIVHGAVGMGVGVFLLIVIGMYVNGLPAAEAAPADNPEGLMQVMTVVHFALLAVLLVLSAMLFNAQFSDARLRSGVNLTLNDAKGRPLTDNGSRCLALMRTAMILRLAMLEGPALFGLVVCLLGAINGFLHTHPLYWVNAASALYFIGYVVQTFPNRQRMEEIFQTRVLKTA